MAAGAELAKKLNIKAGSRLRLINVPVEIGRLLTEDCEVKPAGLGEPCDGAIVFCSDPAEVASFAAQVLVEVPGHGLLWFAYRKGVMAKTTGLSRDVGWEPLAAAGLRPVRSVSIDEEWTGLRFRPVTAVSGSGTSVHGWIARNINPSKP